MNNLTTMTTAASANPAAAVIIAIAILLIAIGVVRAIILLVNALISAINSENPTPTKNIAELIRAFRGTDN